MIGPQESRKPYEEMGYPCFEDHSLAVRAMAALRYFSDAFKQVKQKVAPSNKVNKLARLEKNISEFEAKSILSTAGIPTNREFLTHSCAWAWEIEVRPWVETF